MSDYSKQLHQIVDEYQMSGEVWPASASDIAAWALKTHRYDLATLTIQKICSRELAQAMREEYITDSKGRRVRAKHPAKISCNGKQIMLWNDIRTASHTYMQMAFSTRRNHIVGECRQMKTDVDSYNDSHPNDEPIQLILDFTCDIEELEELSNEKDYTDHEAIFLDELDLVN